MHYFLCINQEKYASYCLFLLFFHINIYIISHIIGYVTIIYFKHFVLQEIGHKLRKLWLSITFFSAHIPLFLIDKIGGTVEGCHLCMSISHHVQYTNRSFGCIWYIIDMTYVILLGQISMHWNCEYDDHTIGTPTSSCR